MPSLQAGLAVTPIRLAYCRCRHQAGASPIVTPACCSSIHFAHQAGRPQKRHIGASSPERSTSPPARRGVTWDTSGALRCQCRSCSPPRLQQHGGGSAQHDAYCPTTRSLHADPTLPEQAASPVPPRNLRVTKNLATSITKACGLEQQAHPQGILAFRVPQTNPLTVASPC